MGWYDEERDYRLSVNLDSGKICNLCCLFSFGWFPGVWFIYADVSEHSICSIFKGRCEVILGQANQANVSTATAYIPYTATTYGQLSRMLAKHNIKSIALPPRKIASYLPQVKDAVGLKTPGIYSIPCECGRVYIGQSGRSIHLRIKEHDRHIRLAQPDKSAVAEHSFNHDHIIRPPPIPIGPSFLGPSMPPVYIDFPSHPRITSHLPLKMEQIECSETSAYINQTPGIHPKENKQGHRILPAVKESLEIQLSWMFLLWVSKKLVTCSNTVAGNNVKLNVSALGNI